MDIVENYQNIQLQQIILALVVGVGFFGISLPYPVITPMILANSFFILPDYISKVIILGIVISIYPLGQFFGSPIFGALSDYYGRKPTLIFTLMGTSIGYIVSGCAVINHNFYLFFFSRLFTGFFEGNIAIGQSAIADIQESGSDKTKGMSLINSAVALGFILGPIIGGLLTEFHAFPKSVDFALPFLLASFLTLLTLIFIFLFFNETLSIQHHQHLRTGKLNKFLIVNNIKELRYNLNLIFKDKNIIFALLVYGLLYIGIDSFYEFYPFYFVIRWQFSVMEIALFSAVYTLPYMFSQLTVVQMAGKLFKEDNILKCMGILCGITLIIIPLFKNQYSLYFFLPILGIFISFCSTNIAVYLSNAATSNNQGGCFGVSQSLRVLNNGLIAIFGGILGSILVGMPFLIGGMAIILSSGILLWRGFNHGNSMG